MNTTEFASIFDAKDRMLSLLFSILQSQVKKFLSCVSPCAAKTLSMFGRTSQIRTGDLYHVKAHRTRHNTLGHVEKYHALRGI